MNWPLLPPVLWKVFLVSIIVPLTLIVVLTHTTEDMTWSILMVVLATGLIVASGMVKISRYKRMEQIVMRIQLLCKLVNSAQHLPEMTALIFEAKQVSSDAVRASEGIDDEDLIYEIHMCNARISELFKSLAAKTTPTAENKQIFQETMANLGRNVGECAKQKVKR